MEHKLKPLKLVKINNASDENCWIVVPFQAEENISKNSSHFNEQSENARKSRNDVEIQQEEVETSESVPYFQRDSNKFEPGCETHLVPEISLHQRDDELVANIYNINQDNEIWMNGPDYFNSDISQFIEPQPSFDETNFLKDLVFSPTPSHRSDHTYGIPVPVRPNYSRNSHQPIEIQSYYSGIHRMNYDSINAASSLDNLELVTPTRVQHITNDTTFKPWSSPHQEVCTPEKLMRGHEVVVYPESSLSHCLYPRTHLPNHQLNGMKFVCQHCMKAFCSERSLRAHLKSHRQPKQHRRCPTSTEDIFHSVFSRRKLTSILKYSLTKRNGDQSTTLSNTHLSRSEIFQCQTCCSTQPSRQHSANNVSYLHPAHLSTLEPPFAFEKKRQPSKITKKFYCYFCFLSFPCKKELHDHIKIYHQFVCNICHVYLSTEENFKFHLQNH